MFSTLIITILFGTLTWIIVRFFLQRKKLNKISDAIGSAPRHPILGGLRLFPRNDPVGTNELYQNYKKNGKI